VQDLLTSSFNSGERVVNTDAASEDHGTVMSLLGILNPFGNFYGIWITLLTTVGCYVLSQKLKYGNSIPEKASKSYFDIWYWSSYIISFSHASIVGALSLVCVLCNDSLIHEIDSYYEPAYWVVCISAGYFIYDLWDEIVHRKETSIAQYVIHHLLVLSILGPCVLTGRFTSICITGLLTEFHNVFLHSRIVVNFYGKSEKRKLKNSLGVANLVTCIIFRLVLFPWIAHVVSRSDLSLSFALLLYLELVYIFTYSLYIFVLSFKTDFPRIANKYLKRAIST